MGVNSKVFKVDRTILQFLGRSDFGCQPLGSVGFKHVFNYFLGNLSLSKIDILFPI